MRKAIVREEIRFRRGRNRYVARQQTPANDRGFDSNQSKEELTSYGKIHESSEPNSCIYDDSCAEYNTAAGFVEGKLNVHLVAHSHDDVGWLKTVDEYYVGTNNSIQVACVENILDSVVDALLRDPNRKFIFAEQRWWVRQDKKVQEKVLILVDSGQLEFVNGGWCMHDEATTHYIDMIDQTTLGHRFIKQQFNKTPCAGWQIDPFGHSAVQAYLLGAELGFESVHFARIDYQDRDNRKENKALEVIWRGSHTFGSSSQIFANAFPVRYGPPDGFHFEVNDISELLQDDPDFSGYNVDQRVNDFVGAAYIQVNLTRTNHIMWTMGDDFQYQYAESWFRQMDKFIHYVNKVLLRHVPLAEAQTSPLIFKCNVNLHAGETEYSPDSNVAPGMQTGNMHIGLAISVVAQVSSDMSEHLAAARQLEIFAGRIKGMNTFKLGDALGIAQHHDAVSGTAQQHVTDDYAKRLAMGAYELQNQIGVINGVVAYAEAVVNYALSGTINAKSGSRSPRPTLRQCQLLNISYCPPTEQDIQADKSLVMVVYNPLGWSRNETVRVPVHDAYLVIRDSVGNIIEGQYVEIDNVTINLRNFYTMAYLGISPGESPKYWVFFPASLPPLGWNTYFISKTSRTGVKTADVSLIKSSQKIVEVGPGNLKMTFSSSSGLLTRMFNSETGVDVPIEQSFGWYTPSVDYSQPSGAYIFRPTDAPFLYSSAMPLKVVCGPLVDEVHQQFSPWIYQVTRLYKDKEHAEVEFTIGPIPGDADSFTGYEIRMDVISSNGYFNFVISIVSVLSKLMEAGNG
ncbi:putative alpha-mannosidase [Drosera capensis]